MGLCFQTTMKNSPESLTFLAKFFTTDKESVINGTLCADIVNFNQTGL